MLLDSPECLYSKLYGQIYVLFLGVEKKRGRVELLHVLGLSVRSENVMIVPDGKFRATSKRRETTLCRHSADCASFHVEVREVIDALSEPPH